MKNQWPFWLFIIAILVVVVISLNYQGKDEVASLGEIFPDEQQAYDYEFQDQARQVSQTVMNQTVAPVKAPEVTAVPKETVVDKFEAAKPVSVSAGSKSFTVQILSSKDLKATEAALAKVKAAGFSDAFIKTADLNEKGIWHRIYVGNYQNKA
ncbi:MAG: SPOR domain-containing protein, partial [Candidatus Omnitrophota bacterium]